MKNIILVGLRYNNNLGDPAIFQSTEKLLAQILDKHHLEEFELRELDMMGMQGIGCSPTLDSVKKTGKGLFFRAERKILRVFNRQYAEQLYRQQIARCVGQKLSDQFIDSDTAAVIFAGGGLINHRHLQPYIERIVEKAEQLHIPTMFSAVGIEGYDETDQYCLRFKKTLNLACVKMITTRDDLDTLRDCYCENNQVIAKVADPACRINQVYPMLRSEKKNCIGLGCVREQLFSDNGIDFPKENMLELWSNMYHSIVRRGYACKIFTNGAVSDEKFADDLLDYMKVDPKDRDEIRLPRPTDVKQLVEYINSFDAVIVGRLHASILAYSYGIPSVGLVWNKKQLLFGEAIHHPERFIRPENFDAEQIVHVTENALQQGYVEQERAAYCSTTMTYIERFVLEYVISKS